jgi:hypothetical protein
MREILTPSSRCERREKIFRKSMQRKGLGVV